MAKPFLLLVDDEPAVLFIYRRHLGRLGYEIEEAHCLRDAKLAVAARRFDAVLLDMRLPDGNGLDWLVELKEEHPDTSVIVISGAGDIPSAVEAMKNGADNFLTKPVDMSELDVFLRKGIEMSSLRRRESTQRRLQRRRTPYFGESAAMGQVMEMVSVAVENDSTVLLLGETGTGKGVMARWIHERGTRAGGPYVELNCSSLRGELLLSELFGHVKGAFTSAYKGKEGLVELASGGTLFLDEIGDMDALVQAQFLKVIEEKTYRRVGDSALRSSDFRLICATNHDLDSLCKAGAFRKDLYYRINSFPIMLPPLRERREDLPGLIRSMTEGLGFPRERLTGEALDALDAYDWPGNLRELKNVLERAYLLSRGGAVGPGHLPGLSAPKGVAPMAMAAAGPLLVGEVERTEVELIRKTLAGAGGDVTEAARRMGISRATLYRKLKRLGH